MKRFLIVLLSVIVLVVIGAMIWLSTLDGKYEVKKSIVINNSPEQVFPLVANYHNWLKWSPWLCMEPNAAVTISDNSNTTGAIYTWKGELVGEGEIEHLEVNSPNEILQEIRFKAPMESTSHVYWNFNAINDTTTEVIWGLKGEMPFLFRFMTKYMEPLVGMDYDRGLKMLKDLSETNHISSKIEIVGVVESPNFYYIGKRTSCEMNEMDASMASIFEELTPIIGNEQIEVNMAVSIYHNFNFTATNIDYTAGFASNTEINLEDSTIITNQMRPTKAVKVIFYGDYKHLGNPWSAAYAFAQAKKLSINTKVDMFELYLTNPQEEPNTDNWITEIYLPVK